MSVQYPLNLRREPDFSVDSLIVHDGIEAAYSAAIAPRSPAPIFAFIGPGGSGKTHIGNIWTARRGGLAVASDAETPGKTWGGRALWLDDANLASEFILFSLINIVQRGECPALLLTAQSTPANWEISLPDLRSRLSNCAIIQIQAPSETALVSICEKLISDQGILAAPGLAAYLVRRCERNTAALQTVISELNAAALAAKRALTRDFAAAFLNHQEELPLL